MPVERAEAAKGVRAGAATACLAAGWKPALRGGGGGRGCPQVANLRLRGGRKGVAGGARRLKTCATRAGAMEGPAGVQRAWMASRRRSRTLAVAPPAPARRGHGWPGGRVFRTSGSCRSRASSAGCSRRRCRTAAGPWGRRRSPSGSRAASGSCPSAPSWGRP